MKRWSRTSLTAASAALVALVAACETVTTRSLVEPEAPSRAEGDHELPRYVTLCKVGPAGTWATFGVSATGGTLLLGSPVTINAADLGDASECREIWQSATGEGTSVTIAETGRSAGTKLDKIVWVAGDVWSEALPPVSSVTLDAINGAVVWFKNVPSDDDGGGEGCTPGYWKNHLGAWTSTPYAPGDDFDATFGVNLWTPNITLGTAINTGGGGVRRLTRHATAALLNASHPIVDYDLPVAQVIAMVQSAAASGDYNAAADVFVPLNENNSTSFCD